MIVVVLPTVPCLEKVHNKMLCQSIEHICILLRESTLTPNCCCELLTAWLDFIGVSDASGHGMGV